MPLQAAIFGPSKLSQEKPEVTPSGKKGYARELFPSGAKIFQEKIELHRGGFNNCEIFLKYFNQMYYFLTIIFSAIYSLNQQVQTKKNTGDL